jgi:hypothetical protein
MAQTEAQKTRAKVARAALQAALNDARGVALYRAASLKQEGATRDSLITAAVAARRNMEANLQRVIDAVRDLADAEGA